MQALVGLDPELRPRLAGLAAGRALVIDYFATARCGGLVGDLTADLVKEPVGAEFVPIRVLETVPCYAERRLMPLLAQVETTIRFGGPPFARHLAVTLDPPERWLDFLERGVGRARTGPRRRS
jgi:hypothetical protein